MGTFTLNSEKASSNETVRVIYLNGVLDMNTVIDFEKKLKELRSDGQYKVVLNLKDVTHISSAGYGVLMSVIKDFRRNRGDIKITHVRSEVYEDFELLELPGLFRIFKTDQEAVNDF